MAYRQGYRDQGPPQRQQTMQYRGGGGNQYRAPQQPQRNGQRPMPRPAQQQPMRAAPRRKKKRSAIKMFFLLVLLAGLATVGIMGYMVYDEINSVESANTFYRGVYVDDVELHGATPQQAYEHLVEKARAGFANWQVQLHFGGNVWTIDSDFLGMNQSLETVVQEAVSKAFYVGRTGSLVDRYFTITELKSEPYRGYTANVEKNTSQLDSIIAEIAAAAYSAPQDAAWAFDATRNGNPVVITPETNGSQLNTQALKEQVISMINTMETGAIQVTPEIIVPNVTAAQLSEQIVLIGSYESPINKHSTDDRNRNVERGCLAFNGKVVSPGEKVSFNRWVGERTEKNGFYPAQEIVSGSYSMGIGGGICQVSSALYNAVIKANLRVVDRTNHSIPVNYMEMGADATVSDGRIDFVFENNTGANIYLIARMESSSKGKTCVFQIYGRPEPNGYTYSLKHQTLEEIPIPEPNYVQDKNAEYVTYTDQEHQTSKGAVGHKVQTFLVTRDASGNVVEEKALYTDTYKAQAPTIYVGVNPRPE